MGKISVEEWREVFALLDTALDMPDAARADWLASLEEHPAQVTKTLRGLLARRTADGFLHHLPQFTGSPDFASNGEPFDTLDVGSQVGPYRLLGRLGQGGMSSVWIAERIDGLLSRRVALKLPHVNWALPEAARRMARERELLGSLEHPNVARLYDAGMGDDGRPYLALELVNGLPIDEYCADRAADTPTRVALVLQTARAIVYAHSRSIIHRDLKPSNILVDAGGQIRLLDFGIGKLLETNVPAGTNDTQFGYRLFTPDYASPEQLRGEPITASSDVFSLGVVLYELLCQKLPFSSRASTIEPRAPSAMCDDSVRAHAVRGDLDTIVLKALKESPRERFATMAEFAQDLERHLRGEPVLARPDSTWYRLGKFASRNRRLVRAVGAAVAVTGAIGIAVGLYQAREARNSAARAVEESADAIAQRSLLSSGSHDMVAYHEYLQARSLMQRPTEVNLREIVRLAESATTRDPAFAHAYALLGGANVLFLDVGYSRSDALTRGEYAARRALELDPALPGAFATLGSVAAHRGQWMLAETHFRRAFELDDQTGRIHARHAQMLLQSAGRLADALQGFLTEFRLTPTHARGAMQVATALSMAAGREVEAMKYVDIALSLGWPDEEADVNTLYWRVALRAGKYQEAAAFQSRALPEAVRNAGGAEIVRLLHASLSDSSQREHALNALGELSSRLQQDATSTFASLMFVMKWSVLLGDLDRAYDVSTQWLQLEKSSGLSGIPHNAEFWLPEMSSFRADPRFDTLTSAMGLTEYWRSYGAPDDCELRARLVCRR